MISIIKKNIRLIVIAICLSTPLVCFYGGYEIFSYRLEKVHGYTEKSSNAIKHSRAAYDMYRLARLVQSPADAMKTAFRLGILNEYIELFLKFFDPDSPVELRKDLHNNLVGITIGEWLETHQSDHSPSEILLILANNQILIVSESLSPYETDGEMTEHSIQQAKDWLIKHAPQARARVLGSLTQLEVRPR